MRMSAEEEPSAGTRILARRQEEDWRFEGGTSAKILLIFSRTFHLQALLHQQSYSDVTTIIPLPSTSPLTNEVHRCHKKYCHSHVLFHCCRCSVPSWCDRLCAGNSPKQRPTAIHRVRHPSHESRRGRRPSRSGARRMRGAQPRHGMVPRGANAGRQVSCCLLTVHLSTRLHMTCSCCDDEDGP